MFGRKHLQMIFSMLAQLRVVLVGFPGAGFPFFDAAGVHPVLLAQQYLPPRGPIDVHFLKTIVFEFNVPNALVGASLTKSLSNCTISE